MGPFRYFMQILQIGTLLSDIQGHRVETAVLQDVTVFRTDIRKAMICNPPRPINPKPTKLR